VEKVDLRVADVIAAEPVKKTEKLLKLRIRLGSEERTIVAGIAQFYTAEEMVGKQIVVVANLQPAKIRGIESKGMLLAADDGERLSVIGPAEACKSRARVI
jgi:methionine--tRNA ligase beta chain